MKITRKKSNNKNENQDEIRLKEFLIEWKQEKPNRKQNTNKKQK